MIKSFSANSFIVGIMLGALLAGAWFIGGNSIPVTVPFSLNSSNNTPVTNTDALPPESGAVSVTVQSAGDTVVVESVTVPPPGVWIAVREINNNDLGNVLGAERVNGPRSSISISLLRSTESSHSYAIELYRDDNNGVFDPAINSVYIDFATGVPAIAYFTTTE